LIRKGSGPVSLHTTLGGDDDREGEQSRLQDGAEALEDSVVIEVFSPIREDYLPDQSV
jgi:hypothetical protein